MDRTKVAVLLPWLKMGGTNKIAINFMRELAEYCDVTLILSQKTGELLDALPENIHLVFDQMKDFRTIVKEDVRHLRLIRLFQDVVYYAKIKMHKDSIDNYRYLVGRNGFICDTEFDCAITYHGQSPERLLNLIYRTHSRKKVAWIHGEISFPEKQCRRMTKYYRMLDHFFFVSNPTRESFTKRIPTLPEKCTVYYNPIDKQDILQKAQEPAEPAFDRECFNILTVGRVSAEKGQDMIPQITRNLLDKGYRICWYIVGDGDLRPKVEQLCVACGVEQQVRFLGTKTNPYAYMHACDLYVQPSYTEGYSTTICEAGMLGKAIIGTKPSGGIRDQITDGEDGLIVDATVEGLTEGILKLLQDKALLHRFEEQIQKKNFEGKGEINKFLEYLSKNE